MILLIDNYDSFSYNVYQLIGSIDPDIRVIRNDEMMVDEVDKLNPGAIILSPGPGRPCDAGICIEVVQKLGHKYSILGICLGHQSICEAYGGVVGYAKQLMHGKTSEITLDNDSALFNGMDKRISVARYHSLETENETLPRCLKITAVTDDNEIMALSHRQFKVYGVQFHPESVLTPKGKQIIENFLEVAYND